MTARKIIWTLLPNGFTGAGADLRLKMSVFVSPRLTFAGGADSGTLGQFDDFKNWPAFLAANRFALRLVVDNNEAAPIATEIRTDPAMAAAWWTSLFKPSMPVRAYRFVNERQPVSSYPAQRLLTEVRQGYGEVGKSSPYQAATQELLKRAFPAFHQAVRRTPSTAQLLPPDDVDNLSPSELSRVHRVLAHELVRRDDAFSFQDKLAMTHRLAAALMRSRPADEAVPLIPETDDPVSVVNQFVAFHRHLPDEDGYRKPELDLLAQQDEFHEALTALGEYPSVLRKLGLVIDLEVPANRIPEAAFGRPRKLRVQPVFNGSPEARTAYTPNTLYLLSRNVAGSVFPVPVFLAAPRGADVADQPASHLFKGEIVGGLLNITKPADAGNGKAFDLIQADVDGASTKVLNAIETLEADDGRPDPIDGAQKAGAPAFRTSGLSLVRVNNASGLMRERERAERYQNAFESAQAADFFAEDLVRGYRVDIRQIPGGAGLDDVAADLPWLSLHQRRGKYALADAPAGGLDKTDEGFLQPAFMQTKIAPGAPSNPYYVQDSVFHWTGWSFSVPPPAKPADVVVPPQTVAAADAGSSSPMTVDFTPVKGSLPRLRFGSAYQVRVRTADLAGNGLDPAQANTLVAAFQAQGGQAPVLGATETFKYLRFEQVPAPELVLRERLTEGETPDVMVIRSNGSTAVAYAQAQSDRRYRAVNDRHVVPPKAALATAELHGMLDAAIGSVGGAERLYNLCRRERATLDDNFIVDLQTGAQRPLPDQPVGKPGHTTIIPNGVEFVQLNPPRAASGYTVHYEPLVTVPYLPDPLARGAALFGLPAVQNTTGELNADGDLKWSMPGDQVLAIEATRQLGFVTKIDYGSANEWPGRVPFRLVLGEIAGSDLPKRPSWDKQTRELTVYLAPGQRQTIWISSFPHRQDVDLFGLHDWWRRQHPGELDRKHFLNMASHGALVMLSPPRKMELVHAVQRPVHAPIETTDNSFHHIRFPNDTVAYIGGAYKVHFISTAKIDLMAEWDEPSESTGERLTFRTHVFEVPLPFGPAPQGSVPIATYQAETQRLEFQVPGGTLPPTQHHLSRHDFGDTKYRKIRYKLVATTRFREFFPDAVVAVPENITATTEEVAVIKSSAMPAAPDISHIVPSFGWFVDMNGPRVTQSARRGGGLRIYLGPSWYSSGDGEQLAVVELDGANRWGLDPIHVQPTATASAAIRPDAAPARAEGSIYDRRIHPYPVSFDKDLGLWYCDVTFHVGNAYFPFRELVLARYQKNSLPGMHVSPLVQAGIHQLHPDRAVTLAYTDIGTDQRKIRIAISAAAVRAASEADEAAASEIEVVLEERPTSRAQWDADLGWSVAGTAPVADRPPLQNQLWTGEVTVPRQGAGKQRRLVIREYERFASSSTVAPTGAAAEQAWLDAPQSTFRRIVYADAIPLP